MIGGGPSLRRFDWQSLKDRPCVAINEAGHEAPWAKILYFNDYSWYAANNDLVHRFAGITATYDENLSARTDVKVHHTGGEGFDTAWPGIRHGNNSGYAAINVAWHFGARKLALLGYDMGPDIADKDRPNYHTRYKRRQFKDWKFRNWIRIFKALEYEEYGMEIVNCSMLSRLECFPKVSIDEVLDWK